VYRRIADYLIVFSFLLSMALALEVQAQSTQQLSLVAASQSSTGFSGVASRALDGNTSGRYNNRSVTHTASGDSQAWWTASLENSSNVAQIELFNRTDGCCSSRLSNFYVFLSDVPFVSTDVNNTLSNPDVWSYYHDGAVGDSLSISVNAAGQYLRIQQTGNEALSLAEVVVTGSAIIDGEPVIEPTSVETPPSVFAAIDDAGTVINGTAVIDILANDLGNIDPTTVATYIPESTSKGYVQINNQTGVITYTPYPGSKGTDTYGYTVLSTDRTTSNVAIVTIAIDEAVACAEPTPKNETISLLLVGNSLMNDIQSRLTDLLDCGGYGSEMATSNPGGNFLHQHDQNPTTTNLIAQSYDLTLLQEQSNSINTNIAPYAVINSLKSKIEAAGSVMGFYQTWGYQERDPIQTEDILSGYDRVADDFNAPLIHIGRAWDYFYTSHNENPPFSLYLDYAHPTEEGKALIAYVLYAYLTGESPIGLYSFLLSEDNALLLQTTAWDSYLANR